MIKMCKELTKDQRNKFLDRAIDGAKKIEEIIDEVLKESKCQTEKKK